jgi:cytochrome c
MKLRALHGFVVCLGIAAALLGACASLQPQVELPPIAERGHAPWVFRSVLDRRPRMITLALSKTLWAAYDTQNASLYKVWRDGVEFDGAVYTTRHGPQPSSEGAGYIVNEIETPWIVRQGAREHTPKVQYLGHRFDAGRAAIRYALLFGDGQRIEIEEWPEAQFAADGRPGFFRRFDILENASKAEVLLSTSVQSLSASEDIETNGHWSVQNNAQRGQTLALRGHLTLRPKQTRFVTTFAREPAVAPPVAESVVDPAVEIMERSDCNVCHNADHHTIGPSYRQIASRYKTTDKNIELLAQKIISGGAGAWGDVVMSPHPEMPPGDAQKLAAYVLAFDKEDAEGIELGSATADVKPTRKLPTGFEPGVTLNYY